ncbi:MAG: hypothetical protein BWY76_00482 [bacterium ADurb.Bin429]|nr:MAG: hypothetical protein BWY76_00482 [bacterium ADurb.Bin429]
MVALTAGDPVAPVLLLHPIEAAGAMHRRGVMGMDGGTLPEETGALEQAFAAFYRILDTILTAGYGCDLGDEGYLADLGDVEDGMLRVGAMRYPVVAVPPAATWRPHTFALLRDFAARGGTLLFIGDPPTELDGVPSDDWLALLARARHISDDPEQLWQSLDAVVPHCFTLRGCDGAPVPHTYINHRRDGTAETLFITNSDDDAVREYVLTWLGDASPSLTRWEPIDGSSARINQGCRTYRFSLPPNGSLLLTAGAEEEALPVYTPITLEGTEVAAAPREWAFTRSEPNVLVLDRMAVTVDDEAWPELSVWKVIGRLNSHFGLTGVERFQPWTLARDDRYTGAGGPVTIRQQFTCAMMPETAALVFDGIVPDALHVNGTPVSLARAGWHWDRAMRAVPVTDALRVGENVVEFHAHYDRMTEMCATSLIGDFAVRLEADGRGTVVPEPVTLTGAPWTEQGYPYYSGAIRYRTTVTGADHSLYLRLADPVAVLVRVAVNDLALSPLMWSPFETALPCRPGDNVIELNVVSSRQNTWYFRRDASGCPMLHPYGLGPVEILAASK